MCGAEGMGSLMALMLLVGVGLIQRVKRGRGSKWRDGVSREVKVLGVSVGVGRCVR